MSRPSFRHSDSSSPRSPTSASRSQATSLCMENFVRKDTVGKVEEIDAKYELLQRGQYTVNVLPADLKPIPLDKNTPLDLYEARNAVRIAKWAGADVSAADSFEKASKLLAQAEAYKARKAGSKPIAMTAREAVQTAEDARLITLKTQAETRSRRNAQLQPAAKQRPTRPLPTLERTPMTPSVARSRSTGADRSRTESMRSLPPQRAADEAKAQAERTRSRMRSLRPTRSGRSKRHKPNVRSWMRNLRHSVLHATKKPRKRQTSWQGSLPPSNPSARSRNCAANW